MGAKLSRWKRNGNREESCCQKGQNRNEDNKNPTTPARNAFNVRGRKRKERSVRFSTTWDSEDSRPVAELSPSPRIRATEGIPDQSRNSHFNDNKPKRSKSSTRTIHSVKRTPKTGQSTAASSRTSSATTSKGTKSKTASKRTKSIQASKNDEGYPEHITSITSSWSALLAMEDLGFDDESTFTDPLSEWSAALQKDLMGTTKEERKFLEGLFEKKKKK